MGIDVSAKTLAVAWRVLYMFALVAIRHDARVRAFYDELVARGKAPRQAIVAVMRKLLHAIWGMFKSKSRWEEERLRRSTPAVGQCAS